ncbi:MAG: hypothetical protein ACJ77N_12705 [Chloroflexota bacterium]
MRSADAAARSVVALIVGAAAALISAGVAIAASPTPTPLAGDPRSSGQGPGLVGDPGFAIAVVVVIAVASVAATLAYVRLTGGPRPNS